ALIVNVPGQIEALSGSCLQVPCSFNSTSNLTRATYALWKSKQKTIFNSRESVNLYPLKIIGNLGEKNCTTLFPDLNSSYTGDYVLRIENRPFKATAFCHPLQIRVRDSPWSPSLNISGDLEENQSVTVTCSAFTPCPHSPPELTWNLQQHSLGQTEKNPDGTFTTKIQETVILSDAHNGYSISCSAGYPVNGGNKTAKAEVTLSVPYVPRNTRASVSPSSGLVSAGSRVELSCCSRAWPPPSFTWFRISRHGGANVSVGSVYTFNATVYCVAANRLGHSRSSVIHVGLREHFYKKCILFFLFFVIETHILLFPT
uniref:Ig-like domain-containing protein n=1 Tax=Poecilia formosa TaxID=48698 RepID=A0A087X8P4_POEFO